MRNNMNYFRSRLPLLFTIVGTLSVLFLCSCTSPKANISQAATTVKAEAAAVRLQATQGITSLEAHTNAVRDANEFIAKATHEAEAIGEPAVKMAVQEPLAGATKALAVGEPPRKAVSDALFAIADSANRVSDAATVVSDNVREVQDVESFWARALRLGFWLVWLVVFVVITIICWRFGLDRIVKAVLVWLAGVWENLGNWLNRKWAGSAKLGVEFSKGLSTAEEFIASLRASNPGFNKAWDKVKDAGVPNA